MRQTTKTATSNKTTAASEKARREALTAVKPAAETVKGKQVTKKADGTKRGAASSKGIRAAQALAGDGSKPLANSAAEIQALEQTKLAGVDEATALEQAGVVLADNEFSFDPREYVQLPSTAKVTKVTKRGGKPLPAPIFAVKFAEAAPEPTPEPVAQPEPAQLTEADKVARLKTLNRELKARHMAAQDMASFVEYGCPATVEELLLAINPPKAGASKGAAKKGAGKASKKATRGADVARKEYCGTDPTQGKAKAMMDEVKKAGAKGLNATVKYPRTGGKNQYPNRVLEALTRAGHLRVENREGDSGTEKVYFLAK